MKKDKGFTLLEVLIALLLLGLISEPIWNALNGGLALGERARMNWEKSQSALRAAEFIQLNHLIGCEWSLQAESLKQTFGSSANYPVILTESPQKNSNLKLVKITVMNPKNKNDTLGNFFVLGKACNERL